MRGQDMPAGQETWWTRPALLSAFSFFFCVGSERGELVLKVTPTAIALMGIIVGIIIRTLC